MGREERRMKGERKGGNRVRRKAEYEKKWTYSCSRKTCKTSIILCTTNQSGIYYMQLHLVYNA